jgi:hypothetical protein
MVSESLGDLESIPGKGREIYEPPACGKVGIFRIRGWKQP